MLSLCGTVAQVILLAAVLDEVRKHGANVVSQLVPVKEEAQAQV